MIRTFVASDPAPNNPSKRTLFWYTCEEAIPIGSIMVGRNIVLQERVSHPQVALSADCICKPCSRPSSDVPNTAPREWNKVQTEERV